MLAGKVAIVTGAGSGIGRACAVALGAQGLAVVVNDVSPEGLPETVALVEAAGGTALAATGDVRSREDVDRLVAHAASTFGGLDVMVANAAVSMYVALEEMSDDELDAVLDTNLRGTLLCARAAIPALRARGGGSIVLVSSVQAYVTLPGCVPYAAAIQTTAGASLYKGFFTDPSGGALPDGLVVSRSGVATYLNQTVTLTNSWNTYNVTFTAAENGSAVGTGRTPSAAWSRRSCGIAAFSASTKCSCRTLTSTTSTACRSCSNASRWGASRSRRRSPTRLRPA